MKTKTLIAALILGAAMISTPALAVDFATPIRKIDGGHLTKAETFPGFAEDKTVATLNDVVQWALLANYQDEVGQDGTEKNKRFWLAKRINDQRKDPTLTADEVALIKRLVAKVFNPLVVGRVWEALDPASVPK